MNPLSISISLFCFILSSILFSVCVLYLIFTTSFPFENSLTYFWNIGSTTSTISFLVFVIIKSNSANFSSHISNSNEIFENFEGGINLENKNKPKAKRKPKRSKMPYRFKYYQFQEYKFKTEIEELEELK